MPALLELDRNAIHRRRQFDRAHADFVLVVARMQHVVAGDLVYLRNRAEITGHGVRNLLELFALQPIEVREPQRLASLPKVELIAGLDGALMHAQRGDAPDVGIDGDPKHVTEKVTVERCQVEPLARAAASPQQLGRIAFERIRH